MGAGGGGSTRGGVGLCCEAWLGFGRAGQTSIPHPFPPRPPLELRIYFDALYRIDLVHARVRTIIEKHDLHVDEMFGLVDEGESQLKINT